jgi:nicotinamide mononucleotide (NMN) deamidase PncC
MIRKSGNRFSEKIMLKQSQSAIAISVDGALGPEGEES